jgi:protein SCO1
MSIKQAYWLLLFLIGGAAVSVGIYFVNYYGDDPESQHNRAENNRLKVINPEDVNEALVDRDMREIGSGHTIADFSFTNQLGEAITNESLGDKIYVANFFFTTCGGICPKMTRQLQRVQGEFSQDKHFGILSHTVNPKIDSVEVMYQYAERFEADHDQWWFLTGSKGDLYIAARKSYLVVPTPEDPNFEHGEESDFIHTENVVLVDPDRRIRGMYDCTSEAEISELMRDIYDLKKEYKFD